MPNGSVPADTGVAVAVPSQLKRWSVRLALHPLGQAEVDVLVDDVDR